MSFFSCLVIEIVHSHPELINTLSVLIQNGKTNMLSQRSEDQGSSTIENDIFEIYKDTDPTGTFTVFLKL